MEDWNNHILSTGGVDGCIVNNDVRVRSHIVETYHGHQQEICGLKWSDSGQQLASGGNDNLIHIWDRSAALANSRTQWLHRLKDHTAAVCALLWNKNERELLSSNRFTENQLTLSKYSSMAKMAELTGHTSRVLHIAQSSDGCTVAYASGDKTLKFRTPEVAKSAPKRPFT
ncbi:hypothetical protein CASFOL_003440 [Castilleja foliolosa]|uniref:Anaphase-promoting complex subunit 4 WD40 domain-containing protein n=1 Tax=Castilleja foliolosa TaxID=1961234 RepID=A0ABD3EHM5_9LAMI